MNSTIENQPDLRRTSRFTVSIRKDAKSSLSAGSVSNDTVTAEKKIFRFYGGSVSARIMRKLSKLNNTIPRTQLVDLHKTDKILGVIDFSI